MAKTQDTTDRRDAKAQTLIDAGKVHLLVGERYALVDGSHGEQYRVNRDGCTCPDWTNRQPEGGCCHMRAARRICQLYKACRTIAIETGRVTIPPELYRAIVPFERREASAPAPAGALVDARGIPYCHSCGADIVNGRCSREAEAQAKREDDFLARQAEAFEGAA